MCGGVCVREYLCVVSQVVGDKVCRAWDFGLSVRSSAKARNNQISNLVFGLCVCRPFGSPCSKPKGKHLNWVGVCVWCVFVSVMAGKRFAYFCDTGATLTWIPYSNSREISVSILSNYRWPCPQTNRIKVQHFCIIMYLGCKMRLLACDDCSHLN